MMHQSSRIIHQMGQCDKLEAKRWDGNALETGHTMQLGMTVTAQGDRSFSGFFMLDKPTKLDAISS
jgi:hypothetical protein